MNGGPAQTHWDSVYTSRAEAERSWSEPAASASLQLIAAAGLQPDDAILDAGGGASRLVDALLTRQFRDLSVLDISSTALQQAAERLGDPAARVHWVVADVTLWQPERTYRLWHDRALFHFLTEEADRTAYRTTLTRAVVSGGYAILATFAEDGPERCSGLPVRRYTAGELAEAVGAGFSLLQAQRAEHRTPWGSLQPFLYGLLRRI